MNLNTLLDDILTDYYGNTAAKEEILALIEREKKEAVEEVLKSQKKIDRKFKRLEKKL